MAIDLNTLKKERIIRAPRLLIYGPAGIGKSTFAAQAPDAIFMDVEGGLDNIECVKYPLNNKLQGYGEAIDLMTSLFSQDHNYKTLVIDTIDWFEQLIHKKVAQDHSKTTIDEIPYGAGFAYALDTFREFLQGLDALRDQKGMAIIINAHADVKKHQNPMGENYDCYVPKLHGATIKGDTALGVVTEWADAVLFANYKVYTKSEQQGFDKNKKLHKAVASERVLYTNSHNPAYRAKNRYNLPDELPFTYQAFYNAFQAGVNGGQK